jgi:cytochrome c5
MEEGTHMRLIITGASLGLAVCIGLAGFTTGVANAKAAATKPAKASPAVLAAGKALIAQYRCNGCHSADLKGKVRNGKPWSPNITESGITGKYTKATFVKLIQTGTTFKGGKVMPPMPVLPQVSSHDAAVMYAYLASQR